MLEYPRSKRAKGTSVARTWVVSLSHRPLRCAAVMLTAPVSLLRFLLGASTVSPCVWKPSGLWRGTTMSERFSMLREFIISATFHCCITAFFSFLIIFLLQRSVWSFVLKGLVCLSQDLRTWRFHARHGPRMRLPRHRRHYLLCGQLEACVTLTSRFIGQIWSTLIKFYDEAWSSRLMKTRKRQTRKRLFDYCHLGWDTALQLLNVARQGCGLTCISCCFLAFLGSHQGWTLGAHSSKERDPKASGREHQEAAPARATEASGRGAQETGRRPGGGGLR